MAAYAAGAMTFDPTDRPTPACCSPKADACIARSFDDKWAGTDEPPEMVGVSARLLDLMRDAPRRRPSVLELGCGPGALSVALLEMGVTHVTGVDLSATSVELARRRAVAAGFGEQARYEVGNAADVDTDQEDWVVLDRVICCFPDMDRLVRHAAPLARSAVLLSVPESRGWRGLVNRVLWGFEAAWDTLRGGCRGYVHDVRRLERRLAESGLRRSDSLHLGLWYLGRYEHA